MSGAASAEKVPVVYRLNILLFVVLMIAGTFWFQRHLELYVTEIVLIGGTMTMWGLLQMLQSWLQWGWGEEASAWNKRFLARPAATEALVCAWLVFLLLAVSTTSVYVSLGGDTRGESNFKVEVRSSSSPLLPPFELSPYEKVGGKPLFLFWRSREVEFRIVHPPGYEARKERLAAWSGLRLTVPQDFTPKQFHVLHIVPGLSIYQGLPAVQDYPDVRYDLQVELAGKSYRLPSLRRQGVFTGAGEVDLNWLVDRQNREKLVEQLIAHIARDVPSSDRGEFIQNWLTNPRFLPTPEFQPADQVRLRVIRVGAGGLETEVVNQLARISSEPVQTVFLEAEQ